MSILSTKLEGNSPDLVRVEREQLPHSTYSNELERWPIKRMRTNEEIERDYQELMQKTKGEAA